MDTSVPAVRIKHADVPTGVVINAEDFDPDKHVLFGEVEASPEADEPAVKRG